MEQITDQLIKAIEKNLPQQVGNVLQGRLKDLANLEIEHEKLIKEHKTLIKEREDQSKKLNTATQKLQNFEKREEKLEEGEKKLAETLMSVSNERLAYQLAVEKTKGNEFLELMKVVFRNTTIKRTIFENLNEISEWDTSTNKNMYRPTGSTKDEIKTKE